MTAQTIVQMISSPVRGAPREIMFQQLALMDRDKYRPAAAFLRMGEREREEFGLESMLPQFEELEIPICVAGMEEVYDVRGAAKLDRFFRDVEAKLIVSHINRADLWAAAMSWWGRCKTVRCVHGLENWRTAEFPDPTWLFRQADRLMLRRDDRLVCVSPSARQVLIDYQNIDPGLIDVIPGGIDTSRFAAASSPFPDGRPPTVAMVTRLQLEKGLLDFVDAVATVQKQVPELRAVVAGQGPHGDEMSEHAATAGASIEFVGHVTDVPAFLDSIDMFILPSFNSKAEFDDRLRIDLWNVAREWQKGFWGDGTPLSLLEALTSGRVCIVSDVGGSHIIEDGHNGRLVPARDPDALASVILGLLADTSAALQLAKTAAAESDRYSMDTMAQSWDRVYDRLLQAP